MYLTARGYLPPLTASPPALLSLVLLLEPGLQRLEVFEERAPVHLPLARHRLERVGPGLAGAEREHLPQALPGLLAPVERALVQRPLLPRRVAHRPIELELEDAGEEIARVRDVPGHVVLGARIEVLLGPCEGRRDALILRPQRPPGLVVVARRGFSAEHVPAPLVDQLSEGKESHLRECVLHLEIDRRLFVGLHRRNQPELLQI